MSDEEPSVQDKTMDAGDTSTVYVPELVLLKRRAAERKDSVPLWLITFTDVMALMLTFFVLLYSMSVPEEDKWEDISAAFTSQFKERYSKPYSAGPTDGIQIDKVSASRALDPDYLQGIIGDLLAQEKIENALLLQRKEGLVVSLPGTLLFDAADPVALREEGKKLLFAVGGIMNRVRNRMDVIGHCDPALARDMAGTYATDWDLSLARAGAVAAFLREAGYDRPLVVHGNAGGRYEALPGDLGEETRADLSRRVDLLITTEGGAIQTFLGSGRALGLWGFVFLSRHVERRWTGLAGYGIILLS